ncbi:polysulfide reductase NrfD [Brachybacterium sp. EF45031]|uniref:NrfD/PsrC family molybdoenzyme membrane anchor subunit n=1 Tax=Brachybacterium sillae TaxID=2810536 RepID=UPI00217EC002|nr:NrfD/PsrC family molybdoenzyme membrane anchor subunit [Brachybacterium sillae]MCS6712289.1 polysulfide reductase NrfD [Brachybacterium sillae]
MSTSEFDAYRPPQSGRRRRGGPRPGAGEKQPAGQSEQQSAAAGSPTGQQIPDAPQIASGRYAGGAGRKPAGEGRRRAAAEGAGEMPMVDDVRFTSYYGRPIIKAPPWGAPIAAYLFLGGVAGGSGLIQLGAHCTGRPALRRTARMAALAALAGGTVALIEDLGRPERFLNMLRTVKVTSPMSIGTWILTGYGLSAGMTGANEIDRLLGERLPLSAIRPLARSLETPAAVSSAIFGAPLAAYTGVLLGSTAVPTWNGARQHLSFVFVSSAAMASAGLALAGTPTREAGPVRLLGAVAAGADLAATRVMEKSMHPVEAEPLHTGKAGAMLTWSERLAVGGAVVGLLGRRNRALSVAGGLAMAAASALTRFAVLEAGLASARDPKHVVEPQKERLAKRRAAGITGDSITTGPKAPAAPADGGTTA